MSQLAGREIYLRPINSSDLPSLSEWDRDPEIHYYMQGNYPGQSLQNSSHNKMHYAILLRDRLIGDIVLDHIAWRSGDAELKVRIGCKSLWNQGYGTDAVLTILDHAFGKMNLSRVYLRVYAKNVRALHCYQKAGFKKEGRLQRINKQNEKDEIILMRILKNEFLRYQKTFRNAI